MESSSEPEEEQNSNDFQSESDTEPESQEFGRGSTDSTMGDQARDPWPPAKRSRHRLSGFNKVWLKSFPWVVQAEDTEGMLCGLCRKHSRCPKKVAVGMAIWVDLPCVRNGL